MLNQNQPEPDGGPVVPILKQQLDQAKTLLMEKDRKIQVQIEIKSLKKFFALCMNLLVGYSSVLFHFGFGFL